MISPSLGALGIPCFVIVAFPWYLHLYFAPQINIMLPLRIDCVD